MATNMNNNAGSLLLPEIGPDGLARESPVIAYTEKVIEQEQLQLRKYIEENYSKIRDVERELANLNMEMKLTSGPKKAGRPLCGNGIDSIDLLIIDSFCFTLSALEHMRKKIEMSTERVRVAKLKEEQAKMVWEAAAKTVQDEEAMKQKLCEDLSNLVQESSNAQFTRLEELKRRLEALNPSRSSTHVSHDGNHAPAQIITTQVGSAVPVTSEAINGSEGSTSNKDYAGYSHVNVQNQQPSSDVEGRGKKKGTVQGRVRGIGAIQKGRGPAAPGWTGAGFDVDGRG